MDDLALLHDLVDGPLPTADDLAHARAEVVAGLTTTRRRRVPFAIIGASALATAAAVIATVTLTRVEPPAAATPGSAADVLSRAHAFLESHADAPAPRGDQYFYLHQFRRETWMSVDDEHDTVIRLEDGTERITGGCVDGRRAMQLELKADPPWYQDCTPYPAMNHLLAGQSGGMAEVLRGSYLPQVVQRALRGDFPAGTPEVVPDLVDADGRHVIGVLWPLDPTREKDDPFKRMVFDKNTYEYLGTPEAAFSRPVVVDEPRERP
ncbi:hypothetical protein [Actinosynnema sp. NPDC020468]|uniref:hypothetical protein n=1 Tax=Actinosynnema sp. NPDC020468 TaxID=3154488 RepID=UPI0033CC9F54